MLISKKKLISILSEFTIPSGEVVIEQLQNGRIHQSFKININSCCWKALDTYVLQRINHEIFPNPNLIMENVKRLMAYQADATLSFIETRTGALLFRDKDGSYYRLMNYIEHTEPELVDDRIYFEGGRILGEFHKAYWDFPASSLQVVLQDFHHTPKRFCHFGAACQLASSERISDAAEEIKFVRKHAVLSDLIIERLGTGDIHYRVTHNDTKLGNMLFFRQKPAGCLIDYDTVMPGAVAWDFGDSIRSIANLVDEETTELEKVYFSMDRFSTFTEGYAQVLCGVLDQEEVNSLVDGVLTITYEQGLRFLTDYLENDRYYPVTNSNQNLMRARVQFELLEQMLLARDAMRAVVEKCFQLSLNPKTTC